MSQKFSQYVNNLNIRQEYKSALLNKDFLKNNPIYYQNYPSLFADTFNVSQDKLELLDIAGFLYYQATLFTDSLIDQKDFSKFPLIAICQEESIKILTSIYGLENKFWHLWNERKDEYVKAIYLEKELQKKDYVELADYETLSNYKSAFGKVAIDCLFSLDNKNNDFHHKLLLSHNYFSVAFQLNDDIQDFKEDIEINQFNWAVYLLKQQKIPNEDPVILEKYLYVRGVSKEMYLLGIDYCNKSLSLIVNIDVPKWKKILNDTKKIFRSAIVEIDNYLEILNADMGMSNEQFINSDLAKSTEFAATYIKTKQRNDGSWHEYINQGGISTTWATAFIISKISENETLRKSFRNEIAKGICFLNQNPIEDLWSYNTTWIEDADSTNFVFLVYLFNNLSIDPALLEKWLKFQHFDGGFSTYADHSNLLTALDDANISNVTGWLSKHNCVCAVSFYFLTNYNQKNNSFLSVKKYFDKNNPNELNSYWWTSTIYTYYYLAKTYHLLQDNNQLDFIIDQIKQAQNYNGSFSDKYGENIFYTGLALEILLLDKNENTFLEIKKTVDFLLKNQYKDGSWQNSNALQVPNARDKKPSEIDFPIASFGMNVRAKEFNRLFTTTTVLQSLSIYELKYNTATL